MDNTTRSLDDHRLRVVVNTTNLGYIVRSIGREDRGALTSAIHDTVPGPDAVPIGFALLTVQKTV